MNSRRHGIVPALLALLAAAAPLAGQQPRAVSIPEQESASSRPAAIVPAPSSSSEVTLVEPVVPYVFFDSASAVLPERYRRFAGWEEAVGFVDTAVAGATVLERQASTLDVIGSRLARNPGATIELVAQASEPWSLDRRALQRARADAVIAYLATVWRVDTARIAVRLPPDPWGVRSTRHPEEFSDFRSVEIRTDAWEILRPIVRRAEGEPYVSATPGDTAWSTVVVPLTGYPFDRFEPGAFNERVLREIVRPLVTPASTVEIVGHTDTRGAEDRNRFLSTRRADTTAKILNAMLPRGSRRPIATRGVGEEEPIFSNELPEGRHLNRAVVLIVRAPVAD